jgi:tetratricopeptide (TPR) repeat protein
MRLYLLCLLSVVCMRLSAQTDVLNRVDSLLLDNQYQRALDLITLAETKTNISSDKILLAIKKAEALLANQKYDDANEILQLVSKQNPTGLVLAHLELTEGMLALYQGRNDLAEEDLLKAVAHFEENNATNSLDMAKVLTTLGLVYYNGGKTAQAEEQLLMAVSIRTKLLPEKHELMAASYNDLGLVYSRTDPDKALTYYEKALPIYETLHGKVHAKIAINKANTGVIYQNLELYGDAINNLEFALNTWEKVSGQPNPRKAFVLHQLGYTYQLMSNNKNAEAYYKKALDEYTKSYGDKHPDIAGELNALGNVEVSKKEFNRALMYFHKALQSNLKNFTNDDPSAIPVAIDYYNGNYLLYSLMYKAEAYESRHFGKTLKFSDLKLSLANLLVCDTLIDKLRQQSNNEADKIALGAIANDVYANGVRVATHMSEVAFINKKHYREQAFYFAEKSKSAVLLEAVSDVSAKSFAGIVRGRKKFKIIHCPVCPKAIAETFCGRGKLLA